jgi:hypothetical protein
VDADLELDPDPNPFEVSGPNNWFGSGAETMQVQIYVIKLEFS